MAFTLNSVEITEKDPCKSQAADGPAHWYGFDMNPAAVAKARLVCDFPVHNVQFVKYDVTVSFMAQVLDTVTYLVPQVLDTAS